MLSVISSLSRSSLVFSLPWSTIGAVLIVDVDGIITFGPTVGLNIADVGDEDGWREFEECWRLWTTGPESTWNIGWGGTRGWFVGDGGLGMM